MIPCRLHILGASGTGTSTLGRAMADHWSVPFHDTDDYFWQPTEPPYTTPRPVPERLALMEAMFLPRRAWVLSGSLMGWGEPLLPHLDRVVFLTLDPAIRMERLRLRAENRYGKQALDPGSAYHVGHIAFMDWARNYDGGDPTFTGRSLARHRAWLSRLPCPVIELDAARPLAALVQAVAAG